MGSWNKGRAFLFMGAHRRVYRCQFTKDLTLIGSADTCDIVIRDRSVEPEHAQISRAGQAYTLRALYDSEVRVDGELIEAGHELMNGDRVEIGDTEILFAREQAESPTTIHLIIRRPGEPPMGFWTSRSTIAVGREKGDIIIDDPLLSKVHAIIENFCDDGYFLIDARSERGTGLNGESIDARHRLRDGDLITVGSVEIEFRANPFENPTAQDAARLAAERVGRLRELGEQRSASAIHGDGGRAAAVPRNPYQRYPSMLPDADPPPAVESAPADPPPVRRRRRGMDLRSGVQTGIVDLGASRPRAERRPRPAVRADSNLPSQAPRRVEPAARADSSHRAEDLPQLQPRPYWGDPAKRGRGFGERSEMETRLSRGNVDQSGLWYLPRTEGEAPQPAAPVPKPIIKPRGDVVPERAPAPREPEPAPRAPARRPIIRRPNAGSGPIRPMPVRDTVAPPPPSDYQAPPVPSHAHATAAPPPERAPGARPDDRERWYIPDERKRAVRQRRGEAAWYLPGSRNQPPPEEPDDRPRRRFDEKDRRNTHTQIFEGDDY